MACAKRGITRWFDYLSNVNTVSDIDKEVQPSSFGYRSVSALSPSYSCTAVQFTTQCFY
jgi:hypothetical protein